MGGSIRNQKERKKHGWNINYCARYRYGLAGKFFSVGCYDKRLRHENRRLKISADVEGLLQWPMVPISAAVTLQSPFTI